MLSSLTLSSYELSWAWEAVLPVACILTLRDPRDHKVSPGIIYGMRVVSSDRLEREGNYKTHPQETKMLP